MSSTVPSERRRSSSWVKTVVRRLEAVRWGPAATAQLSLRQRRESTGTSGRATGGGGGSRAAGGGERLGRGGERPGEAGERPAVGGDDRLVVAGVGQVRRAGDPPADHA